MKTISKYPIAGVPEEIPRGGGGLAVFDSPDALAINQARLTHLEGLGLPVAGRSVLDVGCGVGHLAQFFVQQGCRVVCTDARPQNIDRLRSIYPGLEAHVANVETDRLAAYGKFDVVLCYGLLYHLEDPVRGLRNMEEACGDLLLLETVISDCPLPASRLADEPAETPNQAVGGLGSRPSPAFVAMALNRLGFPFVYAPLIPPAHPDFEFEWRGNLDDARDGHLLRCIFVASRRRLENPQLELLLSGSSSPGGSATAQLDNATLLQRAQTLEFVRPMGLYPGWFFSADWNRPEPDYQTRQEIWAEFNRRRLEEFFEYRWYDGLRLNLYLGNDLSRQLFIGGCADPNEFALLDKMIVPGMVVLDAGANDGLYTLFCARATGAGGAVLSFEPSGREFARLERNVELNGFRNVRAFRAAFANEDGETELRVAGYGHEGQNTLGQFNYEGVELLRVERVPVRRIDSVFAESGLARLDFLKLDIEGGETRALEGARNVLRDQRPILLFEAVDSSLRQQGSSRQQLFQLVREAGYVLYTFNSAGLPCPGVEDPVNENVVATPAERPLPAAWCGVAGVKAEPSAPIVKIPGAAEFRPGIAFWQQRHALANLRERLQMLRQAVNAPQDMWLYQYAQLIASALEFQPDLVLELGRCSGNSTSAFAEASHQAGGAIRIVSVCDSSEWTRTTVPRLRSVAPDAWFAPLDVRTGDILKQDYDAILAGSRRVILFWDAHGFDVAECVLGRILPLLAAREHLVFMHDISDNRYVSREHMAYGQDRLWRSSNWSGPRLKIGNIDSAVEQAIAALDFTTRNRLTLDSADHSLHNDLSEEQRSALKATLGDLFDTQAHWFYFTLNEHAGPYTFPRFEPPKWGWKWK